MATKVDAGARLLRLLAVLTWLARQGRATVTELSERFGLEPDELIADLELAACCGVPPYSPDQLMEIIVDDQEVIADLGTELGRPRRLTAAEGFALAASARAILAVPGADPDGALGRAVAKLEAVLGGRGLLRVDLREPAHLAVIRDATEGRRQLELRYYSASSDRESTRIVDPVSVRLIEGHWYLDGFCHNAQGMRRFRVDRVLDGRLTGETSPSGSDSEALDEVTRRRPSSPDPRPPWPISPSTTKRCGSPRPCSTRRRSRVPTAAPPSPWPWRARCGSAASCSASAPMPRCSTPRSWPTWAAKPPPPAGAPPLTPHGVTWCAWGRADPR